MTKRTFDADSDGYFSDVDCDDGHATVNPDAPEVCDGLDNDCDEQVDEADDVDDGTLYFADADGDGHGAGAGVASCDPLPGFAESDDDCDDEDAANFPGNDEICDGADNDCDREIDENALDEVTYYADSDGDGYGDEALLVFACAPPTGYVDDSTDCEDADPAVHPDAPETDCSDPTDYNCDGSVAYADADGDGVAACEDCDDTNAARSPDATEVCDEADVDEDCDGGADDADGDATGTTTWTRDSDRDGYGGTDAITAVQCEAPAGFAASTGDCDDFDAAVNPGAAEVCDALDVDEDCDGAADDADASVDPTSWSRWYRDADADAYGDASTYVDSCSMAASYVADATDCDDSDAAVNPGATETCDGVDQDCDGTVDEGATDASTWYIDSDSDGYGDASTAAVRCDEPAGYVTDATDCDDTQPAVNPGEAEVCGDAVDDDCDGVAPRCPGIGSRSLSSADAEYWGAAASDGAWVAGSAGDFDGDGYDDVLVGAYGQDDAGASAGAAYLVYGSGSPRSMSLASADLRWTGEAAGDLAGYALAGVGDVDADGFDDILVGARYNDDGATNAGAAYLLLGSASPADGSLSSAVQYRGEATSDEAGFAVGAAGDVDADGFGDFLIGAIANNDGGSDAGAAYLVLGSATPASSSLSTAVEYRGEAANDWAGVAVDGLGDFDADGFDDILVGARHNDDGGANAGAAYLVLGGGTMSSMSLSSADAEYRGEAADDIVGYRLSRAGDINGDGYDDALVGALWNDDGGYSLAGSSYLVLGTAAPASGSLSGAIEYTGYGYWDYAATVADAGDLDLDGYDDFLVGAQGNDDAGASAGATYIVLGSSAPAPMSFTAADAVLWGASADENSAGSVVGNLDVNGDGLLDVLVGAVLNADGGTDAGAVYLVLGGS